MTEEDRRKARASRLTGLIGLVAATSLAASGCGSAEADPPLSEDDLPEDIYSVQQTYQAHYDSVLAERGTLMETVAAGAPALRAYLDAKDARGGSFAADGVIQDHIEECRQLTDRLGDETIPETTELLVALNDGRVGIERFKLRFARFDGEWVATNDCWRELWADPTVAAWRDRWAAQKDSLASEARARARARERARVARMEREAAEEQARFERWKARNDSMESARVARMEREAAEEQARFEREKARNDSIRVVNARRAEEEGRRAYLRNKCLSDRQRRIQIRAPEWETVELVEYIEYDNVAQRLVGPPTVMVVFGRIESGEDAGKYRYTGFGDDAPRWLDRRAWLDMEPFRREDPQWTARLLNKAVEQWKAAFEQRIASMASTWASCGD